MDYVVMSILTYTTTIPIMDVVIYMGPFIVGVPKKEKKDLRTLGPTFYK